MTHNPVKYRVFVCTKQRDDSDPEGCCTNCGGPEIAAAFQSEIQQRQLENQVEIRRSGCLDHCEMGAVALVSAVKRYEPSWLPSKIQKRVLSHKHYYGQLTVADVPEIVEQHFVNGQPVDRKSLSK
jgi:(2Fe-2S) ferredoxin